MPPLPDPLPPEGETTTETPDDAAWAAAGIGALERYLARHAAFDRWCRDHRRRYGRDPGPVEPD